MDPVLFEAQGTIVVGRMCDTHLLLQVLPTCHRSWKHVIYNGERCRERATQVPLRGVTQGLLGGPEALTGWRVSKSRLGELGSSAPTLQSSLEAAEGAAVADVARTGVVLEGDHCFCFVLFLVCTKALFVRDSGGRSLRSECLAWVPVNAPSLARTWLTFYRSISLSHGEESKQLSGTFPHEYTHVASFNFTLTNRQARV